MLSLDDISKIPRLPGDGAQDEADSTFDESNEAQLDWCRPSIVSLHDNIPDSEYTHTESK